MRFRRALDHGNVTEALSSEFYASRMKRKRPLVSVLLMALVLSLLAGCSLGDSDEGVAQETSTGVVTASRAGGEGIPLDELRNAGAIVFVRGEGEASRTSVSGELYVAHPDGTEQRLLPSRKKWNEDGLEDVASTAARWSPDGRSIALAKYGWAGDPWGWTEVVSAEGLRSKVLSRPHPEGPYQAPSWSPNGARLLIKRSELEILPVRGGTPRKVPLQGQRAVAVTDPDWSPDGGQIAIAVLYKGIAVTSSAGGRLQYLAKGEVRDPAWSPDASRIAFARKAPTRFRGVWVVGADGVSLRQLTSGVDESPRWSPDGSKILFRRFEQHGGRKGTWELYVMDADGDRQTRLPFNRAPEDPRFGLGILSADWR